MEVTYQYGAMPIASVYQIERTVVFTAASPTGGPTDSVALSIEMMTEEGAKQLVLSSRERWGIPKYGLDWWE